MSRTLRTALTTNLPISALAFAAYLAYGALNGFDFDHEFLGVERGPHSGKVTWPVPIMVETFIIIAFIVQRRLEEPQTRGARWFYVLSGTTGLIFMPERGSTISDARLFALGLYVWLSVIAYGALLRDPDNKKASPMQVSASVSPHH